MFTPTVTVDDSMGYAKDFKLIRQDGTGTLRIDTLSSLSEPRTLSIKHSIQGKGAAAIDRHLIQLQKQDTGDSGVLESCIVNLTVALPRSGTFSNGDVHNLLAFLMSFLLNMSAFDAAESLGTWDTTNIDGLLIGEA
jgi:hypothetical protein